MELETLKLLLNKNERKTLYLEIINKLEKLDKLEYISYKKFETSEGIIPIIFITKTLDKDEIKPVKMFIGAQHNEYNGLFGILEFLKMVQEQKINIEEILKKDQILIFLPLMNPYGFLNPSKDNKSGYYLKNGTNLNRFWRRTFAPEYQNFNDDHIEYPIPEHAKIVKRVLNNYWEKEDIPIYVLDFHETSLLERIPNELNRELKKKSITYKFDHWLKENIILNVMELYDIKYYKKPLFFKCNPSANHNHINLSIKQIDYVFEKLLEYLRANREKLPFYFCYCEKSKEYCESVAYEVYNTLKDNLWETCCPAVDHFHDHGCFVKLGDATPRKNLFSMELESQKQFFNLFEEIEKSKTDPNYYENKLKCINLGIELAKEAIFALIKKF
ncbi:MAG: hypothetical protein EU529_07935 [Promethearchaeota archaeon]|nr:MAG: hypothetical protein EU529_07935 [Candidatus Lokiarchaeota archaeon]